MLFGHYFFFEMGDVPYDFIVEMQTMTENGKGKWIYYLKYAAVNESYDNDFKKIYDQVYGVMFYTKPKSLVEAMQLVAPYVKVIGGIEDIDVAEARMRHFLHTSEYGEFRPADPETKTVVKRSLADYGYRWLYGGILTLVGDNFISLYKNVKIELPKRKRDEDTESVDSDKTKELDMPIMTPKRLFTPSSST